MKQLRGVAGALAWCEQRRRTSSDDAALEVARGVIGAVAAEGDEALRRFSREFDGVVPGSFRVPEAELGGAEGRLSADLSSAIRTAMARVEAYYRRQPAGEFRLEEQDAALGMLVRPLDSVGIYVPGGTAPLFSSLIMIGVPARVAGVERLVVATPPGKDGSVPAEILFVAALLGAEAVVAVGGAQAIAAMAFGTASVPRVDKLFGPGNRYVVAAKRLLFGRVGIESLPGPTETMIVADGNAAQSHVVADLLAQAEHEGAQPVLVTTSGELAAGIGLALERALTDLPTAATARRSLSANGVVIVVDDLQEAIEVANAFAPEHLCLLVDDPGSLVGKVRNAGGLFLGPASLEALGDYLAGPSHVMPTASTARFSSFVNLRDFQKVIPFLDATPGFVARVGPAAALMARAEGLEAHARAIELRLGRG